MSKFKNNHRRHRFKSSGDRNFRKRNGNGHKMNGDFNPSSEFRRRNPGRNNQNAGKLIEKYNDLAREALSNGDKILSENYLQHADHFSRITNSQEISKVASHNLDQTDLKEKDDNLEKDISTDEDKATTNKSEVVD